MSVCGRRATLRGWRDAARFWPASCARLGAKENALALPLVLLAYELLFQGIRWRNLGWPSALVVLDIPYLYFKTHGAAAMASLAGYAPEYTVRHFIGAWGRFLGYLLVRDQDLEPWVAASILMGLLAVAVAARSELSRWHG